MFGVLPKERLPLQTRVRKDHPMNRLLNLLFRCRHKLISRVFSGPQGNYVICLNCGQRFAYDWQSMQLGEKMEKSDV